MENNVSKWDELLKSLKIDSDENTHQNLSKLELWYLQHISKQPLFDSATAADKKLILLKQEISHFLETVHEISGDKCSEFYDHLGGMNPIQYASKKGYDIYLSENLESNKEVINVATNGQLTPLHLAAYYGHHLTSKLLLEHGAKSNLPSRLKQTPAHLALSLPPSVPVKDKLNLMERKQIIFHDLLAHNPKNIFSTDISDNTLAHAAAENGFALVLEYLLKNQPRLLRVKNSTAHTPLHSAILNNQNDSVKVLIKDKTLLLIPNKNGRLPIHYAAIHSKASILADIVCESCLDSTDLTLKTPLMFAAEQGHIDNVKLLIAKGANVKARDQYGKGILDYALASLNFELVKWLVSNVEEIDVNQQDENGRTPLMNLLHETVSSGTDTHIIQQLVSYLLETGTKPDQVDKYGQSLQDYLEFLESTPKIVL